MKREASVKNPSGSVITLTLRENQILTKKLEFIYASLEWLHIFNASAQMPVHVYLSHLPWIKKHEPEQIMPFSSVQAKLNQENVIILHDELTDKEIVSELLRQSLHSIYPNLSMQILQARMIECLERISSNYDFITHHNNHLHFHARDISPYELSKGIFIKAYEQQLASGNYGVTALNYKKIAGSQISPAKTALRIGSGIFILGSMIVSTQTITGNVIIESPEKSSLLGIGLLLLGISALLFSFIERS